MNIPPARRRAGFAFEAVPEEIVCHLCLAYQRAHASARRRQRNRVSVQMC